ncbi:TPR [Pyrrhoderma noxium]|uniref:TPR n=1 Tax=Pyrrhoderma noxium TaxID=2282107 RepID=A0A286UTA9_9AGAM|nr:TPR [Pyrrhoderma noxium]
MAQSSSSSPSQPLELPSTDEMLHNQSTDKVSVNIGGDGIGDHSEEDTIKKCLGDAEELKQEGTSYFKEQNWKQAITTYTCALGQLPKRVVYKKGADGNTTAKASAEGEDEDGSSKVEYNVEKPEEQLAGEDEDRKEGVEQPPKLTGIYLELAKARSVLNANIGACHLKLEEYKEAVTACTEALADDPSYVKALQRRASCNEKIGSWSSLAAAQEDYTRLLELLPSNSPLIPPIRRSLSSLKPRIEEAQKKETGEMIQKLKGIGNSILGNFGLSTDNFKFEPNGQGGYSMNFVR